MEVHAHVFLPCRSSKASWAVCLTFLRWLMTWIVWLSAWSREGGIVRIWGERGTSCAKEKWWSLKWKNLDSLAVTGRWSEGELKFVNVGSKIKVRISMERFKLLAYEIDQWWTLFEKDIANVKMLPHDLACVKFHFIVARQINDNFWTIQKTHNLRLSLAF